MVNILPTKDTVDYNRIYEFNSKDYDLKNLFKPYFANRGGRDDVIKKHIQEIKAGIIADGGTDKIPPIIVDINTFTIGDGHCRYAADVSLLEEGVMEDITIRVIFEDIPAEEFDERVIKLNMGQKSWGLLDFIKNYELRGFEGHKKLIDFCERTETLHDGKNIKPRYAAAALGISHQMFRNPNFSITDEEIERGKEIVYEANQIRMKFRPDIKANGGGWYEQFLMAWAEFRMSDGLKDVTFKKYLSEVNNTVKNRKSKVEVPYGSNKKREWNTFFRAILTYC